MPHPLPTSAPQRADTGGSVVSGCAAARFRVLIGCEYSATVRDAFRARGFDAWSCDLLPTEGDPRWHIQGDCRDAINGPWDLIILHVPCTGMAVCGNRTYGMGKPLYFQRVEAIGWTLGTVELAMANAPHVALENPASVIFPTLRNAFNADVQYVQPWQHGHPEQKKTGLALWDLPRLIPTKDVRTEMMALPRKDRERVFFMSPGPDRGKERARFYTGLAEAMADQWGDFLLNARPCDNRGGSGADDLSFHAS